MITRRFLPVLILLFAAGCRSAAPTGIPTAQPLAATATAATANMPVSEPEPSVTPSATLSPAPTATNTPIPTEAAESTAEPVVAAAGGDFTNVYSGPGPEYTLMAILSAGFQVEVVGTGQGGSWLVVGLPGGEQGWVQAELIESSQGITGLPAVEAPFKPPPSATPFPQPQVTVSPEALAPNAEYTVTILYFGSRERITIKVVFVEKGSLELKIVTRTREDGSADLVLATSRSAEMGTYVLSVSGESGAYGEATFYIGPPP